MGWLRRQDRQAAFSLKAAAGPVEKRAVMDIETLPDDVAPATAGFAAAVLDALPEATAILDKDGTIVAVNRAWRMFTLDNGGRPEDTGVGVSYLQVCRRAAALGCVDAAEVVAGLRAVLAGETVESDRQYPCPSPTTGRWFASRITPIRHSNGGAVVSHRNISRQKQSEEELAQLASHDSLTGLPNRRMFIQRLGTFLEAAGAGVGLLSVDLDNFKLVNDMFGHDAGDEVLLGVAHRLRHHGRPRDTVGRLGGDEFAVCAPAISGEELAALAERLRTALAQPHQIHGRRTWVRGSVGAYLAASAESVADTVRLADRARYADKTSGRPGRWSADLEPPSRWPGPGSGPRAH